ncbi:MAG: hypothetical protein AAGB30_11095 [Pedobacter sp.]
MDEFQVDIDGLVITIKPDEDGHFDIFKKGSKLGTIEPNIMDDGNLVWSTADLMAISFAQKSGMAIEKKEF